MNQPTAEDAIIKLIETSTASLAEYGTNRHHTTANAESRCDTIHGMIDCLAILMHGTRYANATDVLRMEATAALRSARKNLAGGAS